MHAQRIEVRSAAGGVESVQPVDILHRAAQTTGALRRRCAHDDDVRVGAFGASIGARENTRVRGGIDRRGAPLQRQVHFVEDLDIRKRPGRVAHDVVHVVLEIGGVQAVHRGRRPVRRPIQTQPDLQPVAARRFDNIGQVVRRRLTPLIVLLEAELAAHRLHGAPGYERTHGGEAGGVRKGSVGQAVENRPVAEARPRRRLLLLGRHRRVWDQQQREQQPQHRHCRSHAQSGPPAFSLAVRRC